MFNPDDLEMMTEKEKLDLIHRLSEAEEWQDTFEPIFRHLMDDDSALVRQDAVSALWDIANPKHIEPLLRKAESDPDVRVRSRAASVLGIFIYEGAVQGGLDEAQFLTVRKFLMDLARNANEDLMVRRMAIEALSFDADDEVNDLIEWGYKHPMLDVRMSAVFAMGRSHQVIWEDQILAELDSPEREMKLEAINAAAEAGLMSATAKLRNLAMTHDRDVRVAAIWALSQTGGPGALETMEMCAQAEDEEVRSTANDAIEEYFNLRREEEEGEEEEDEDDDEDSETQEK